MKYTTMKLGQILVNSGVLSQQTLEKALSEQKGTTKRLGEILIENKHITERQLLIPSPISWTFPIWTWMG